MTWHYFVIHLRFLLFFWLKLPVPFFPFLNVEPFHVQLAYEPALQHEPFHVPYEPFELVVAVIAVVAFVAVAAVA